MKWLDKIKNLITKTERPSAVLDDERLLEWLGIKGTSKKILNEVTYFTCLKMLSETLSKMPVKFYQQTDKGIEDRKSTRQNSKPTNDTNYILEHSRKQP